MMGVPPSLQQQQQQPYPRSLQIIQNLSGVWVGSARITHWLLTVVQHAYEESDLVASTVNTRSQPQDKRRAISMQNTSTVTPHSQLVPPHGTFTRKSSQRLVELRRIPQAVLWRAALPGVDIRNPAHWTQATN